MSIKIYTDAGSNLFKNILEQKNLDITVLPMSVKLGEKEYKCYDDDINVEELSESFYNQMKDGVLTKTSLTNPGLFIKHIEKEIEEGNQVIYVSLASGISSTFQTSQMFANEINEEHKETLVKVIDSKTASFGEAMIAIYAYNLVCEGLSFEEVVSKTEDYVSKVRSEFTVDSIKYLANTGRVSKLTATIATVLSIKPLLYGSMEGKIEVTSKCRGRNNSINALTEQVIKHIKNKEQTVYIAHCNAIDDANKIKEKLIEAGIKNVEVYFYDLVTGAHVGPGTLAVFYEGDNRTIERKSIVKDIISKIKREPNN